MPTFASVGCYEASLTDLKESSATEKADLEKSIIASEERLADAERCIEAFGNKKDTLNNFATQVDEAWAR